MNTVRSPRVLVVEDDADLRLGLIDNLESEGYSVQGAARGDRAWPLLEAERYDLVVLDVMLPDGDGYALCRRMREAGMSSPVLMLTARSLEDDLVAGFDSGADDYLTKPYRLRELLVRVRALLRRSGEAREVQPELHLGEFLIQRDPRTVQDARGAEISLTPTEFDLLVFLVDHPGEALPRRRILDEVWGRGVVVDGRTVDNFVSNLKRKLRWHEGCGFRIATVRSVGYRLDVDVVEEEG